MQGISRKRDYTLCCDYIIYNGDRNAEKLLICKIAKPENKKAAKRGKYDRALRVEKTDFPAL
uniref:Uncharacterized protein n=1 Tax=Romanomermis culicivorax TaxID=13658 RepID=A0A915IGW2_ROMCU